MEDACAIARQNGTTSLTPRVATRTRPEGRYYELPFLHFTVTRLNMAILD